MCVLYSDKMHFERTVSTAPYYLEKYTYFPLARNHQISYTFLAVGVRKCVYACPTAFAPRARIVTILSAFWRRDPKQADNIHTFTTVPSRSTDLQSFLLTTLSALKQKSICNMKNLFFRVLGALKKKFF